jgi:uncharacterized protein YyaL (SSP411 family)
MSNSLSEETSPYLLQHAGNPVAWLPWGAAAFERAQREDKPVFLSVGYSTCHWCHVMERESFESEEVAAVMNHHFINVKVDREEHPEVDATYMAYVQATTGQGGWPMSVWLTPEGNPIVGGTYFPPEDRYGRPGFARLCQEIGNIWQIDRDKLVSQGRLTMQRLQQRADESNPALAGDVAAFDEFLDECHDLFDAELGGFGTAPKFPRPVTLEALLSMYNRFGAASDKGRGAWEMIEKTLHGMAAGGIHDQLRGGFHRYSVDRFWHVPHFEKMLYDQAQLASVYLTAWQVSRDPQLRQVAERIFDYVIGELADPCGGFHAAEDADSLPTPTANENLEGAYWTWRAEEIQQLLDPQDAAIFCAAYGVEQAGNARPESDPHHELAGRNTLFLAATPEDLATTFNQDPRSLALRLDGARATVLTARAQRPLPHRDDKIITAWNAMMISAMARGARLLDRPDLLAAASAALEFVHNELWDEAAGLLGRSFRRRRSGVDGFPQDYAALIAALLEMAAADPAQRWLNWACRLQEAMDERFWDQDRSGYVMRATLGAETLMTLKEDYDGAEPSANSMSALNLLRLSTLVDRPLWSRRAQQILAASAANLRQQPHAVPLLLTAFDLADRGLARLEVGGEALRRVANATWHPRLVMLATATPQALLCDPNGCRPPITDPQELRRALAELFGAADPTSRS